MLLDLPSLLLSGAADSIAPGLQQLFKDASHKPVHGESEEGDGAAHPGGHSQLF